MNSVAPGGGTAGDAVELVRKYKAWEGSNVTPITFFLFYPIESGLHLLFDRFLVERYATIIKLDQFEIIRFNFEVYRGRFLFDVMSISQFCF